MKIIIHFSFLRLRVAQQLGRVTWRLGLHVGLGRVARRLASGGAAALDVCRGYQRSCLKGAKSLGSFVEPTRVR